MKENRLTPDAIKTSAVKPRSKTISKASSANPAKNEIEAFDAFWEFVRKAEIDIEANGHIGCPQPQLYGGSWDEEFADAYKAIEPYLRKYRGEHITYPPKGMTWRSRPHYTKTAHQGLMEFLNPTEEVYGYPGLLQTREYLATKDAALSELKARLADKKKSSESLAQKSYDRKIKFMSDLSGYHNPKKGVEFLKPLTIHQIVKLMKQKYPGEDGWNYSSVRRLLNLAFEGVKGYHKFLSEGYKHRGDGRKNADGSMEYEVVENENSDYRANKRRK